MNLATPFTRPRRMEWINLRTATLRLPQYIGSGPVQRATWLNLLAYCVEQENGGKIADGLSWGDRQWQQTCGVTRGEVKAAKLLVTISGKDVLVWGYPHEKEREVQAKRKGGKEAMERRWSKARESNSSANSATNSLTPLSNSPDNSVTSSAYTEGEGEGEGKGTSTGPTRPRVRVGASAREALISETWTFILGIFGKKNRAPSYLTKDALDRQIDSLPLSEKDRASLAWFYSLPEDPRDIDLRGRFRDADRLAQNLFPAIERAEAYAKKTGPAEKKSAAPEPAGWRDAFFAVYPDAEAPETWEEFCRLGASVRKPVLDRLAKNGGPEA